MDLHAKIVVQDTIFHEVFAFLAFNLIVKLVILIHASNVMMDIFGILQLIYANHQYKMLVEAYAYNVDLMQTLASIVYKAIS